VPDRRLAGCTVNRQFDTSGLAAQPPDRLTV
jgi:hypothetical protein